jgi:hypothetical protein
VLWSPQRARSRAPRAPSPDVASVELELDIDGVAGPDTRFLSHRTIQAEMSSQRPRPSPRASAATSTRSISTCAVISIPVDVTSARASTSRSGPSLPGFPGAPSLPVLSSLRRASRHRHPPSSPLRFPSCLSSRPGRSTRLSRRRPIPTAHPLTGRTSGSEVPQPTPTVPASGWRTPARAGLSRAPLTALSGPSSLCLSPRPRAGRRRPASVPRPWRSARSGRSSTTGRTSASRSARRRRTCCLSEPHRCFAWKGALFDLALASREKE